MEKLLKDKVAIITGGGGGIGFATAKLFAEEGADIVIAELDMKKAENAKKEIENETGKRVLTLEVDVSKKKQVDDMVKRAVNEFGKIDILVNNVGIYLADSVLTLSEEVWDKVIDTDLKGTFLCSQAAAKEMVKGGYGKIINISSCCAIEPTPGQVAYGAAKAGVVSLTRDFAFELGEKGIYANAILPGMTVTDMTKDFLKTEKAREEWRNKNVLKRLGQPVDQAKVALFLASSLSDHVTGECIITSAGAVMGQ
ncbi:MAG: SDR family oxidoreductase [Spirochaetota bacterium]|nr:MAG: SDR family oxidoreductase [Spirochaetota bacterium]